MRIPDARVVILAADLNILGFPERECLFYSAVGQMRDGRFGDALETIRTLTTEHPAFMRGVALREVFKRQVQSKAPGGALVLAGGIALLGLALWWFFGGKRDTPRLDSDVRDRGK